MRILTLAIGAMVGSQAQVLLHWNSDFANDGRVPSDGHSWHDARTLQGLSGLIQNIQVHLQLSEEYYEGNNGDLFAFLSHDGQMVVLLNRVGRAAASEYGYLDGGFDITLTDLGATDVHFYGGNNGNPLIGTYQPDGRDIDPTSPRALFNTAPRQNSGQPLALFNGMDPNGDWILCVSDHETVGASVVESWGMTLDLAVVPEPYQMALAGALVCCAVTLARHVNRSKNRPRNQP